jgi:hypothetical protein
VKTIILKNPSASSVVTIGELGLTIQASQSAQLSYNEIMLLDSSTALKTAIAAGTVIVNNGTADLGATAAVTYLTLDVDLTPYYTQAQVNSLLTSKIDLTYLQSNYYTSSAIDTKIAASATYGIKGAVTAKSNLPTTAKEGDIYIVRTNVGADLEGFYQYTSSAWVWLAPNVGNTDHNSLTNLNVGDYKHLTAAQLTGLTGAADTTLHSHGTQYYSKALMDAQMLLKANATHNHDASYYTKAQVDTTISGINFAAVSANDSTTDVTGAELEKLTNGSDATGLHTHSDIINLINNNNGGGSLDDAYDNGVGRTINIGSGAVELTASGGYAPLRLTPISYTPNQALAGGEICYWNTEPYYYDATRQTWLSMSTITIFGNYNSSSIKNVYMRLGDTVFTASHGLVMPFKGTIVGMSISAAATTNNSIVLRKNGTDTAATLYYSGTTKASSDLLDIDFNAGDVLNFFINNSANTNTPIAMAYLKKRL